MGGGPRLSDRADSTSWVKGSCKSHTICGVYYVLAVHFRNLGTKTRAIASLNLEHVDWSIVETSSTQKPMETRCLSQGQVDSEPEQLI